MRKWNVRLETAIGIFHGSHGDVGKCRGMWFGKKCPHHGEYESRLRWFGDNRVCATRFGEVFAKEYLFVIIASCFSGGMGIKDEITFQTAFGGRVRYLKTYDGIYSPKGTKPGRPNDKKTFGALLKFLKGLK